MVLFVKKSKSQSRVKQWGIHQYGMHVYIYLSLSPSPSPACSFIMKCIPEKGKGFRLDAYHCICRAGFFMRKQDHLVKADGEWLSGIVGRNHTRPQAHPPNSPGRYLRQKAETKSRCKASGRWTSKEDVNWGIKNLTGMDGSVRSNKTCKSKLDAE